MALTGSNEVMVGETAVFELKVTMKDAANVFIVDAFAPINRTNIMSLCSVRLKSHGKSFFSFTVLQRKFFFRNIESDFTCTMQQT